MVYKIADLITSVPESGGMAPRLRAYLHEGADQVEIEIREEDYRLHLWPGMRPELAVYMESGIQFYVQLLHYDGLLLHASAVELDGRAYLFSGLSGVGKSTHTRLWQDVFGEAARVFNDDKPALRRIDGRWYAYGTPWCGKDGININTRVPLAGICMMKQGEKNIIRQLKGMEAISSVLNQTMYNLFPAEMHLLLDHMDKLICEVPVFELENRPEPEAAKLSYETMRRAAVEAGL